MLVFLMSCIDDVIVVDTLPPLTSMRACFIIFYTLRKFGTHKGPTLSFWEKALRRTLHQSVSLSKQFQVEPFMKPKNLLLSNEPVLSVVNCIVCKFPCYPLIFHSFPLSVFFRMDDGQQTTNRKLSIKLLLYYIHIKH